MVTILDALRGINAYPIPLRAIDETAARRGLSLTDEATQTALSTPAYRLSKADILLWLSLAPDITQGGQQFGFTDEQRKQLRQQAYAIYNEDDPQTMTAVGVKYGYKGSRL
jgi:hypothetical protein